MVSKNVVDELVSLFERLNYVPGPQTKFSKEMEFEIQRLWLKAGYPDYHQWNDALDEALEIRYINLHDSNYYEEKWID